MDVINFERRHRLAAVLVNGSPALGVNRVYPPRSSSHEQPQAMALHNSAAIYVLDEPRDAPLLNRQAHKALRLRSKRS